MTSEIVKCKTNTSMLAICIRTLRWKWIMKNLLCSWSINVVHRREILLTAESSSQAYLYLNNRTVSDVIEVKRHRSLHLHSFTIQHLQSLIWVVQWMFSVHLWTQRGNMQITICFIDQSFQFVISVIARRVLDSFQLNLSNTTPFSFHVIKFESNSQCFPVLVFLYIVTCHAHPVWVKKVNQMCGSFLFKILYR